MNLQEIYDFGLNHVRAQGCAGFAGAGCLYLTPEGNRCVVGGFIDDPKIALSVNEFAFCNLQKIAKGAKDVAGADRVSESTAKAFTAALEAKGVDLTDEKVIKLLTLMQGAHDSAANADHASFLILFEQGMRDVAQRLKIQYKEPTP